MKNSQPKLALGPVSYYWARDTLLDFYEQMAETTIDIIYLGETICSKRKILRTSDWLALAERLVIAAELKTLRKLCENEHFMIEANDMAAVQLLEGTLSIIHAP